MLGYSVPCFKCILSNISVSRPGDNVKAFLGLAAKSASQWSFDAWKSIFAFHQVRPPLQPFYMHSFKEIKLFTQFPPNYQYRDHRQCWWGRCRTYRSQPTEKDSQLLPSPNKAHLVKEAGNKQKEKNSIQVTSTCWECKGGPGQCCRYGGALGFVSLVSLASLPLPWRVKNAP